MVDKNNTFNFLGILLIVIVVIQSFMITYIFIKINDINQIYEKQNLKLILLNKTLDNQNSYIIYLEDTLESVKDEIVSTRNDLTKEVGIIQAKTTADFTNIIESSKKSVVSIKTDVSQGTGFLITNDGYVVTNFHVISDASYANAITNDKQTKTMELIGYDNKMDIALLKIEGSYNALELYDSDDLKVGEKVIAIGNPLGLSFSVSEGIISALNRQGSNGISAYIQTDASLNPGNSGGPLINTDGYIVGINNFKANAENIGFALESNFIKDTVNKISLKKLNQTLIG